MIVTMFAATDHQLGVMRNLGAIDPSILELPRVEIGSLSPYALVTLDAAVTGETPNVLVDLVLEPLEIVDDGAQLLFAARPELTAALQEADDVLAESAGATWASTAEMQRDGWQPSDCQRVLQSLIAFAGRFDAQWRLYSFLRV